MTRFGVGTGTAGAAVDAIGGNASGVVRGDGELGAAYGIGYGSSAVDPFGMNMGDSSKFGDGYGTGHGYRPYGFRMRYYETFSDGCWRKL